MLHYRTYGPGRSKRKYQQLIAFAAIQGTRHACHRTIRREEVVRFVKVLEDRHKSDYSLARSYLEPGDLQSALNLRRMYARREAALMEPWTIWRLVLWMVKWPTRDAPYADIPQLHDLKVIEQFRFPKSTLSFSVDEEQRLITRAAVRAFDG